MIQPTATTYALLALLALRPWTGYELTQQASRSLHYAWPRSEAHLYNEQKRLVRLGWAAQEKEAVGRRTRNRYTITADGRVALRDWFATEPQSPRLEIEGLLRVFFADQGEADDVVAALHQTAEAARTDLDRMLDFVEDYLETGGEFPERLHLIALSVDLITDLLARMESFARGAADEITGWGATRDLGMTPDTRRRLEGVLERHRGRSGDAKAD